MCVCVCVTCGTCGDVETCVAATTLLAGMETCVCVCVCVCVTYVTCGDMETCVAATTLLAGMEKEASVGDAAS